MKSIFLIFCSILILSSFKSDKGIIVDKFQAQKAFTYLNMIRADPDNYSKELTYKKGLETSKIKLQWNDTLAKVAEAKAFDMANRDYFGHIDPGGYGIDHFINLSGYKLNPAWLKNKADNYFESLAAGTQTGEEAIKVLIIDKETPGLGHRKHLLGLDKWNSSLKDIGIGFIKRASGSVFKTYTCVIIAKHDW